MLTETENISEVETARPTRRGSVLVLLPGDGINKKNVIRDLLYGCWCNGRRIGGMQMPPVNHLYVSTMLKNSGHEVTFLDAQIDYPAYEKLEQNNFSGLDFLMMLSSSNSYKEDLNVARFIKSKNPSIKVLFWGSHPTFAPESCLEEDAIDYVVIREPEMTIRDLVNGVIEGTDLSGIKGCGYKKDGKVCINPFEGFFDMNQLPIPDWTLLPKGVDYFNPVVKRMPYATMQTSRGCPAKCIYCTSPFFYGNDIRVKSAENVMKEIRYLVGLGYKEIFFRDETFTAYKKRNMEICQAILDEGIDVTWIANGRVDMIDRESAVMMKRAGCHMLKFGVETGDDQMLLNLKKGATVAQAKEAFKICHEVGLDTHAHMVFGGPGESKETIKNTLQFILEIDPTTASFGILTPYPGTEHFEMVKKEFPEYSGTEADMAKLHTTPYYAQVLTELHGDDLQKTIGKAYRTFYFRPSYIWKWLRKIESVDELLRLMVAGSNIFQFGLTNNK
ncbi:MAG: radical SAM protein [Candidatus Nitrohelix vancouverensis]|uniref:Radical SAM protein n=1 Tax=Candidatus Nitrohelix vancouverensis TaxID=2705534 RepID=A0A7T0C2I9_9BACT|nr:MAG: radical SAM protein [Candidatus Nitrohelix vancouverensis]